MKRSSAAGDRERGGPRRPSLASQRRHGSTSQPTRRAWGRWVLGLALGAAGMSASPASADEPWLLDVEADLAAPLNAPQRDWFRPGASLAAAVQKPLLPWLALTARLRTLGLFDGDAPDKPNTAAPGFGTLNTLGLGASFRLPTGDVRRATGAFIDAVAGGGFTGKDLRPSFELGAGYGFAIAPRIALAPVARYLQVIQPNDGLNGRDAKLLLVGVRVSLFDAEPDEEPAQVDPTAPPPPDRDADGIYDEVDACPDVAEDKDGFQDEDGCPEADNDGDGVLDTADGCPNMAEDKDGFEDQDGCPDYDNDGDGLVDPKDQCPLEPETVNGENDEDGCPDSGLIVMQDDRIVLEERVLFDFERAKITRAGEPVLSAIVRLWKQHPEWRKVRIEGHADVRGDATFNQTLSERRAIVVRQGLVRHGMPEDIITAEGFGATRPITDGTSDADHQANRRVEFVVIARDGSAAPLTPAAPPTPAGPRPATPKTESKP
jgi:outer membrane protein OmpA-like peptidoglycan-associated protein